MLVKIYRIATYYRFLWWLIPISKTDKMFPGHACYEMTKMLRFPERTPQLVRTGMLHDFLTHTYILSGSKKFKFGKRLRMEV